MSINSTKAFLDISNYLGNLKDTDLVNLWNDYCENDNRMTEQIFELDEDTINNIVFYGDRPWEVINSIQKFDVRDNWVHIDSDGFVTTTSDPYRWVDVDHMINYITDNEDDLGNSEIAEILEKGKEEEANKEKLKETLFAMDVDHLNKVYNAFLEYEDYNPYFEQIKPMSEFNKVYRNVKPLELWERMCGPMFLETDKYFYEDTEETTSDEDFYGIKSFSDIDNAPYDVEILYSMLIDWEVSLEELNEMVKD